MILLTRAFITFKPDILIPITKVDNNMTIAHEIDSLNFVYYWKDLNIKNIIKKFIEENQLSESDFDDMCCFIDRVDREILPTTDCNGDN
mmetsp:Transcript_33639/g.28427  ORF Transcript_33639/g.28427 Transcript_33639/m.28427 type:complete len:89 (+) Transcript_33639:160-426(+)